MAGFYLKLKFKTNLAKRKKKKPIWLGWAGAGAAVEYEVARVTALIVTSVWGSSVNVEVPEMPEFSWNC